MKKQLVIDTLNRQTKMHPELKQEILDYISTFPEELTTEDEQKIDQFLAEVVEDESQVAYIAQSLLDESEKLLTSLKNAKSEYTISAARTLKTGLSHLDRLDNSD